MALQGSKIGQSVSVRAVGDKRVDGVIVGIDSHGLRCVAGADGHTWHTPSELDAAETEVPSKVVTDLKEGDEVVLFNGAVRTVASVVRTGNPPRYRVTFVEDHLKPLGIMREQTVEANAVFVLAAAQ